jgi:CheY-like chemotaxis protein
VLRVWDNGMGIAADLLPHVFDLFVQAPRTLGRAEGGLGIGLTLVKQLVEFHDGTIEASSPGLGCGSEFTVRLPAVPREAQPLELPKLRVLVVDDLEDATEVLASLLKDEGFDVRVAHSGEEALEVSRLQRPDVGLLDIGLPGMNGYELAQRMRQEVARELFLVAVTGYGDEEAKKRANEAGFNLHITKPLFGNAMETLLATLRRQAAS